MANLPSDRPELEFMIKLHEGGGFSGLLAHGQIAAGDELSVTGRYGVFTLRASSPRRILFIGGGAGMAPILSPLRSMRESGVARPAAYCYGARRPYDLSHLDELEQLVRDLRDFTFVPALSEPTDDVGWTGETGLITDVVDRMEDDLADVDARATVYEDVTVDVQPDPARWLSQGRSTPSRTGRAATRRSGRP